MPYRSRQHVVASTQQNLRVPVKRTPRIDAKIIACIDCPAQIGEHCVGSTGKRLGRSHISRTRLANRKMNEERDT